MRAFESRADRASGDGYGSSIRVKTNIAEVLRRELARKSWRQESVTLGAATDPYQPAEARFRLTRACISELARAHTPLGIITRGPLIVRDIDVLQDASTRVPVSVNVSVPTLDEQVWRTTELPPASPIAPQRGRQSDRSNSRSRSDVAATPGRPRRPRAKTGVVPCPS